MKVFVGVTALLIAVPLVSGAHTPSQIKKLEQDLASEKAQNRSLRATVQTDAHEIAGLRNQVQELRKQLEDGAAVSRKVVPPPVLERVDPRLKETNPKP